MKSSEKRGSRIRQLLISLVILLASVKAAKAQALTTSDYFVMLFLVLGAIISTFIIIMIIHHYVKHKEKVASDPRVIQLAKHFRNYIDNGYTRKQIIDSAIKQGWPKSMIESAMKHV